MHPIITFYMLLLYYTPVVTVYVQRGVFTVGVVVSRTTLTLVDSLVGYSYINAQAGSPNGASFLARCLTGLAPTSTSRNANGALGGLYFNGTMITNSDETASCGSDTIQVRPGSTTAGVINMLQCGTFSTSVEGIYTCTMMNSSMMDQSVRFGIYFNGRSESFDLYLPSLNHLHLSTQLLQ